MITKKEVYEFLKSKENCVLSTASKTGKTQSAVMVYALKDDFTFYFITENTSRKYKNIKENNSVSIVVGGWNNDATIQLDGNIRELEGKEALDAKGFVLKLHPEWKGYFEDEKTRIFEVKTLWGRYSDFSKEPSEKLEF